MDLKEILHFLELPEKSSGRQIRKRIEEMLQKFQHLSENAPSAFLRRLNRQHVEKIMLIKKESIHFQQQGIFLAMDEPEMEEDEVPETEQEIIEPAIEPAAEETRVEEPEPPQAVAFLIRHTENQAVKPFPLFHGKNYIGRKMHLVLAPFIALETDDFVSRIHAVISVDDGSCAVEDSDGANEGKASKNGTFVNGNKKRITGLVKLKESDVIQIGETKLIFRMNTKHLDELVDEVEDKDYMHTVVIRK